MDEGLGARVGAEFMFLQRGARQGRRPLRHRRGCYRHARETYPPAAPGDETILNPRRGGSTTTGVPILTRL